MKKLISLLVIVSILFSSSGVLCVSANESKEPYTEASEYVNNELEVTEKAESKIICDATLDDDFEEDSVIVIFKNDKSRKFESHNTKSFPEVTATSVEDLTKHYKIRKEKQRNINEQTKATLSSETSATNDEMYVDENKFHQIVKINLESKGKENVLKYIKKLEARDDVLMAFPNYIYKSAVEANDTGYEDDNDWAIDKINLPAAWNITTGSSSVKVGIIDSGIDATNPDLSTRVSTTLGDCFTGIGTKLTDEGGHGTPVAGIVGAHGNNNEGITGVCWAVTLVSLKAAVKSGNACTMSYENLVKAINYATENNIPILNYSYGNIGNENEVKIALGNYSGLFVCAAGNERTDISNTSMYPIDYNFDNTIVVAGTDKYDELYTSVRSDGTISGSNYSATKVDLAAPGKDIGTTSTSSSHYTTTGGTSIAAPFVAGVAALLLSEYPDMETRTLKYYILNKGVDIIGELEDKVSTSGRLNAYKALSSVKKYTVEYAANGGSGTMDKTEVIYNNFTNLRKNTFTKSGYTFKGWYAKRASDSKCYYTNGSSGKWFIEGTQTSGYTKYLYTDQQVVFNSTTVNNDVVTLTAQWAPNNYTIRFNGNDAYSGTMEDMEVVYATPYYLTKNAFDRGNDTKMTHWYAKKGNLMYYTGATGAGWYTHGNQPSGYARKEFTDGMYIGASTLTEISSDDVITMNAYWEPLYDLLGDVNMDTFVNIKDSTIIQNFLSKTTELTEYQQKIGDVNFSGSLSVKDSTMIQKYIAGTIDEFGA